MKVLVTGGAGYLGSVVSRVLLEQGKQVRGVDSLLHGGQAVLGLYPFDGYEFVRGDLRDPDAVARALDGVDAVVHLAAIVGDPACKREPELARAVNLDASLALYEAARESGTSRFLFASTCSNYGRMEDPLVPVTEQSELSPLSLYAESKVAVEEALLGAPAGGPAITILRFATLFGLSPRPRFDLTVNEFAAELELTRRLQVYGRQFWRPYIHVRDAAEAVRLVLDAPIAAVAGEVFNAGDSRENYRKGDIVDIAVEEVDGPVEIDNVDIADDPRDYRVGFEKIEQRLGFRATRTVRDGIREVLAAIHHGVLPDVSDPRYRN